jgi:hypothetical protein
MAFSELRGDNDFLAFAYGWHSYRHNEICHRCFASAVAPEVIWTDMSDSAGWLSTLLTTEHYFENTPIAHRSPICSWPGWSLDSTVNDTMHGMNLGCDQHVAANCILDIVESMELPVRRHSHLSPQLLAPTPAGGLQLIAAWPEFGRPGRICHFAKNAENAVHPPAAQRPGARHFRNVSQHGIPAPSGQHRAKQQQFGGLQRGWMQKVGGLITL